MNPFVISFLLGVVCLSFSNVQEPQNSNELVIDLAQCKKDTRTLLWDLGSENFIVKGRSKKVCVIEHLSELEGGYNKSLCKFPTKIKKISVSVQASTNEHGPIHYSVDFSKFCKVVESGNLLGKPPEALYSYLNAISGSTFVARRAGM